MYELSPVVFEVCSVTAAKHLNSLYQSCVCCLVLLYLTHAADYNLIL